MGFNLGFKELNSNKKIIMLSILQAEIVIVILGCRSAVFGDVIFKI